MKKLFLLCAALLGGCVYCPAQTNGVTITPDQVATIDKAVKTGLAALPASDQSTVNLIINIIGFAMIGGRILYGFAKGGFYQGVHGLLFGSNTPHPPGEIPKGATLLKCAILLALPALLLTGSGCKSTQVVTFTKGTGLDLDLPLGYNGANFFEMKMKIGQFYNATAVQPVATNSVYVPSVAFASSTDGSVSAPQVGTGSGTNFASVTGGDKFTGSVGDGTGAISNLVGTTVSTGKR